MSHVGDGGSDVPREKLREGPFVLGKTLPIHRQDLIDAPNIRVIFFCPNVKPHRRSIERNTLPFRVFKKNLRG